MHALSKIRLVLWLAVAAVVVATAGSIGYRQLERATTEHSGEVPRLGGPFKLVDGDGNEVTDADLHGQPFAVFFGFTNCPDVCPTSLFELSAWIDSLGEDAERMRFAFVSVDPERDTPERMKLYVGSFSDDILPLTGSTEQVQQVIDAYRVYARKVPLEGGDYTMDHSAFIYLMDANGAYHSHITYGEAPDRAVAKLQELIGTSS